MSTKYKMTHERENRRVSSIIEFSNPDTAQHLAVALNKKFPTRRYRVETVKLSEKERILELVK